MEPPRELGLLLLELGLPLLVRGQLQRQQLLQGLELQRELLLRLRRLLPLLRNIRYH